jgi:hypothetical protein
MQNAALVYYCEIDPVTSTMLMRILVVLIAYCIVLNFSSISLTMNISALQSSGVQSSMLASFDHPSYAGWSQFSAAELVDNY